MNSTSTRFIDKKLSIRPSKFKKRLELKYQCPFPNKQLLANLLFP